MGVCDSQFFEVWKEEEGRQGESLGGGDVVVARDDGDEGRRADEFGGV